MEGNPTHPVTRMMDQNWHKVVGIMMLCARKTEFEVTPDMIDALGHSGLGVCADCRGGKFIVRLVTDEEGKAVMRAEAQGN